MQAGKITWLPVGQVGTIRLDIPVYTIGSGKPIFGITCFVHGNEPAGAYIVSRLIDQLQLSNSLYGTVHILPMVNPAAQFINSRVSPLDQKDLNRMGYGRQDGSLTERIGASLFEFLSQCDMVVNIHEFEMHTPTTAVFMNAGSTELKINTLTAIKAFSPDIIWVIDISQSSDEQYRLTLDTALASAGVTNFPIETAQLAYLTDTDIEKASQGLLRVATHIGILEPATVNPFSPAPAFIRQEIRTNDAGLWEPNVELMQVVKSGDLIGTLRAIPEFKIQSLYSPVSGVLVQYRHRELVSTGTSLFSIGRTAEEIVVPLL